LDLKVIKQVIDLMKRSELSEFEFEEEGFKLRLSRKNGDAPQIVQAAPSPLPAAPAPVAESAESPIPVEDKNITTVKSPMVGTFYSAGSPESPAFVKVGDKIGSESIVCIIEAMKVMNEIQAELSGTVTELLVENGEAVEYGQPLFKVKTA
jgi:acetyl-CoA carboxylase biotin carboxyl carrier protein